MQAWVGALEVLKIHPLFNQNKSTFVFSYILCVCVVFQEKVHSLFKRKNVCKLLINMKMFPNYKVPCKYRYIDRFFYYIHTKRMKSAH